MNINRIRQLKTMNISKDNLPTDFFEKNHQILDNFAEEDIEQMIFHYMLRTNITMKDIENIRDIVFKKTGEKWGKDISLVEFFYSFLTEMILLPDYCENNIEFFEKEVFAIIDRTMTAAMKSIETREKDKDFCFHFPTVQDIRNEFLILGNMETREADFGGIFGLVTMENSRQENFRISIPIRTHSHHKDTKINPEISAKKVQNYVKNNFEPSDSPDIFFMPMEKSEGVAIFLEEKIDVERVFGYNAGDKYLILNIISSDYITDSMTDTTISSIINTALWAAEKILQDMADKSNVEHKKRIFNFSNGYFVDIVTIEHWKPTNIVLWWDFEEDDEKNNKNENNKDNNNFLEKFLVKKSEPVTLADIGGQKEAKTEMEKIIKSIQHADIMASWWAKPTSGLVLEWPPWTGKTLLAQALAHEVNAEVYNIKLTDIATSAYINAWANNIKKIFTELKKRSESGKKIIVILDEMDAIFSRRDNTHASQEDVKIVNTFLTELSGFDTIQNVIFIGTTNRLENIDKAVIRSGRLSTKITVNLPDKEAISQIFDIHLGKIAKISKKFSFLLQNFSLENIVKIAHQKNISGADIAEVVRIIVEKKAMEEINGNENISLTEQDFIDAISQVKKAHKKDFNFGFVK